MGAPLVRVEYKVVGEEKHWQRGGGGRGGGRLPLSPLPLPPPPVPILSAYWPLHALPSAAMLRSALVTTMTSGGKDIELQMGRSW